jgi:hypothetical protein
MKINELQEAAATPKNEANKLRNEFQAILDDAGVAIPGLRILSERINESTGKFVRIGIYGSAVPKIKNGEYDPDEADIALRLAHRLISKWLAQKEADGHHVTVGKDSDVGGGNKFSAFPYSVWTGSKDIDAPGFRVSVSISSKTNTRAAKKVKTSSI